MSQMPGQNEIAYALAALEMNSKAIPWSERRKLAASLGVELDKTDQRDIVLKLVNILVDDPKWEVRKEIALLLPRFSDSDFSSLASKLLEDSNGFVRKAAETSFERRRRGRVQNSHPRGGILELVTEIEMLANAYGSRVSNKVRRLAEKLYDEMAGAAVHEIRGILTPLKSTAMKLRDDSKRSSLDRTRIGTDLDTITRRLDLLERFINDMRGYSEPVPIERKRERLENVVTEACHLAREALRKADCDLERIAMSVSVDSQITFPIARHYIIAAIRNLVRNAYEAVIIRGKGENAGQISVEIIMVEGKEIRIIVEDNGIGISSEDLHELRAFVPGRISKKGNGTGFGLPTAQRYIEAHGGSIIIESTENIGTTVSLVLPAEG